MATVNELIEELQEHIRLAQQALARSEFAEGAIMQPHRDFGSHRWVAPVTQIEEFCTLIQSSLDTIKKTAKEK